MRCVSNEPQELVDLAGVLQLEGAPSKLELLLAMEKGLMATCEIAGQENARRNLSLVRRLILRERIKEWIAYQQVKIATGFRVVFEEAKGWIDGLVEGVEDFLYPQATLSPAVITRGAIRTRGARKTKPSAAVLNVKEHTAIDANISLEGGKIDILLQREGQPLGGVKVWMVSATGQTLDEATTDSSGRVCFFKLPSGTSVLLIGEPQS